MAKDHDQRVVHSSEDPNWRTPRALYDALNRVFGFELDVAADAKTTLHDCWFGPGSPYGEDALTVPWNEFEGERPAWCFLNPPYSKKLYRTTKNPAYLIDNWAAKCWEEAQRGATVVGLFPFSPQTLWYRTYVMGFLPVASGSSGWNGFSASEVWRLPYRVTFDPSPEYVARVDAEYVAGERKNDKIGSAGHNVVVVIWRPDPGFVGPWGPVERYWSYR